MTNQKRSPWAVHAIPKVVSLALASLTLIMTHRPLPMTLDWAQDKALLNMGVVIWPLVMLSWLYGLPYKRQLLGLFLGIATGYLLMGRPLIVIFHGMLVPNLDLVPNVIFAMIFGLVLYFVLDYQGSKLWANRLLWGAPAIGIGLLLVTINPTNAALRLQPGEVRPGQLAFEVTETYQLQTSLLLAAYTYGDVLVVVGDDEWLWRDGEGQVQVRSGSYDPWRVQMYGDGPYFYIVETAQGRIECYHYPDGELLWIREDLGVIFDIAWTADYCWVLNCPDVDNIWPWPEDPEVILHRLNLTTGQGEEAKIVPPENRFWKKERPLAYLEANHEQAWVVGWSSPEQEVYPSSTTFFYTPETDQPFVHRPAQGKYEESLLSLPDGLKTYHELLGAMSYYLAGSTVIDVAPTATFTDYFIRARSILTGHELWQLQLFWNPTRPAPVPFPVDGRVLVDGEHGVLCLKEDSGDELWSFPHATQLRWVEPVGDDVILALVDGTIVRMGANGQLVWQYNAQGLSNLEDLDTAAGTLTIKDSGIKNGEGVSFTLGGTYVVLSLADGRVIPVDKSPLEGGNFAVQGEFLWRMKRFSYNPGPYNGDEAIYRLNGERVTVRDLNISREGLLVRSDYILVGEQVGNKARIQILRVRD